jgi:predicted nucleic acid-binding protein
MRAGELFFIDTNVLVYWLDESDRSKHEMARRWIEALWEGPRGRVSWQVLNEFYVNGVRKLGARPRDVRVVVESLARLQPVGFGLALVQRAWHWETKAGVPYWDGLIIAAAESAECSFLLSEDFQAGQKFGKVTVIHPFRTKVEDVFR